MDGGLYERLGWSTVQQMRKDGIDFLVMFKRLDDPPTDGAA